MKREEILEHIKGLSHSQGSYGHLYQTLMEMKEEDPEAYEEVMQEWEAQNFKDPVELVIYIEEE